MAIILILFGTALKIVGGVLDGSRQDRVRGELLVLQQSLEAYKAAFHDYPRKPVDGFAGPPADMEEVLFNALNGKLAPDGSSVSHKSLLDNSSLTLKTGNYPDPLGTVSVANKVVDPWENPYVYLYDPKDASWTDFGYVLYSTGADLASAADDIYAE